MKSVFNLPGRTPSLNKTLGMHWAARAKLKKEWMRKIVIICGVARGTETKVRVSFTSFRKRLLDRDNYIGGLKSVLDCLVQCGWLKDDSAQWCESHYNQEQSDKEYLRIELEPINGEETK